MAKEPYLGADRPDQIERFDDPTEAAKRRQLLQTNPEVPKRKPAGTFKVAVPPPGAGNKEPPKRSFSPPPTEDPQPTSADYGQKVVELGETQEALETEQRRRQQAEARIRELENEARARAAENAPQSQPGAPPKVETEAIIITRRGFSFPWGMAPWVIAALAGGWAAKGHVDQAAPSAKDTAVTAAVAAKGVDDTAASVSANATEIATVKAECRENVAYLLDTIEALRPGLEVVRPANVPAAREMLVNAKSADAAAPLRPGGPIKIERKPSPSAQPFR